MPGKAIALRPAATVAVPPPGSLPFPQRDQQRKSEAVPLAFARWAKRNGHFTVPLAIPPVMWLAGLVLHAFRLAGYAALCGALLTACVWYFAGNKWDRKQERIYARLSVSLGSAWLCLAAWLGPLGGFIASVAFAATLLAGCGTWGWFWYRHKRPRGMRQRERLIAECNAFWQRHCWNWNLGGSRVIDAEIRNVTLRIRVQAVGGQHSIETFRQAIPLITSAADGMTDHGLVRVAEVKGRTSQVDIFLKQDNPLREDVEFDLSLAPSSVRQPMAIGRSETAAWKMLPQRANCFVIGASRTGKSNHQLVRMAALTGCRDARTILIDLKGGRSARPVLQAGCAEYVVTSLDEARALLWFLHAEIQARAKYAYDGNEQLQATEDVPSLHLFIDETHGLTSTANGDSECAAKLALVASQGMGLEVYVEVYTQFGSLEESVRTEQTRGNLHVRVCYRVEEARHGAYVIPEYAQLDASKLEEKGTCYIKDGPKVFPEQVRAPKMDHSLFAAVASQNAAHLGARPPLRLYCGEEMSPVGVTWQQWWDERWLRLDPAFRKISPQYQAAAAGHPHAAAEVIASAQRAAEPVAAPSPGTGDARSAAARIAAEDADLMAQVPDDFRPDPKIVAQLPRIMRSQEERFADELQAATAASPATPGDLASACGQGRTWVHGRLSALMEIGCVTQVSHGRYIPVPGADIARGLVEIKARNARLAREAREIVDAG